MSRPSVLGFCSRQTGLCPVPRHALWFPASDLLVKPWPPSSEPSAVPYLEEPFPSLKTHLRPSISLFPLRARVFPLTSYPLPCLPAPAQHALLCSTAHPLTSSPINKYSAGALGETPREAPGDPQGQSRLLLLAGAPGPSVSRDPVSPTGEFGADRAS